MGRRIREKQKRQRYHLDTILAFVSRQLNRGEVAVGGEDGVGQYLEWRKDIRIAADSTMLRMVNLFMALSLGVHLEQLEHRIGLT